MRITKKTPSGIVEQHYSLQSQKISEIIAAAYDPKESQGKLTKILYMTYDATNESGLLATEAMDLLQEQRNQRLGLKQYQECEVNIQIDKNAALNKLIGIRAIIEGLRGASRKRYAESKDQILT